MNILVLNAAYYSNKAAVISLNLKLMAALLVDYCVSYGNDPLSLILGRAWEKLCLRWTA